MAAGAPRAGSHVQPWERGSGRWAVPSGSCDGRRAHAAFRSAALRARTRLCVAAGFGASCPAELLRTERSQLNSGYGIM